MSLVSPDSEMGNDRWSLKTFTGGSDERNGSLGHGKALNSRLKIVGLGFQNHTNRCLLRLPVSE
jgi:hypothetical protein